MFRKTTSWRRAIGGGFLRSRGWASAIAACHQWAFDFNHVRPDDALAGKTPAEVYGTPMPQRSIVELPTYPSGYVTRRVRSDGGITMSGDRVSIGRPFVGQLIGLKYEAGLRWRAHFYNCDLGPIEIASHDLILTEGGQL